ncbi:protein BCL9 homolog [Musca autumnalis]|uniref:protein BCL9 homolog n=1 Tax=Musca autumnalis TaxID=221902 RepID=UPI003CEEB3C6
MSKNYCESYAETSTTSSTDQNGMQHTIKTSNSPCEEDNAQGIQKSTDGSGNSSMRDGTSGDIDTLGNNSNVAGSGSSPNARKPLTKQNSLSKTKHQNIATPPSKIIRDEHEIKKEATSSPGSPLPLGFGNNSGSSNCENDERGTNKTTNPSPLPVEKNSTFHSRIGSELLDHEHPTSASRTIPGSSITSANIDTCGLLNPNISPRSQVNTFNGNLAKFNCPPHQQQMENYGGAGGGVTHNSSEYMQQQNHVFVFSTQLANKSAEAVLGGQFPTIIAYHCMQPSTKLLLEDFLKNPSRTSKLQRQYSLNLMNAMQAASSCGRGDGGGSQPYWLNDCNNSGKIPHRLRNVVAGGGPNKPNQMWDAMNETGCPISNPLDLLAGPNEHFDNAKAAAILGAMKMEDKANMIPSLQGVKVPDENLTPQQRQHREEQLAKLKKMNKFLFPENDGSDFHPATIHGSDAGSTGTVGDMLHNVSASNADKMYQQTLRNMPGNLGSESTIPPDLMTNNPLDTTTMPSNKHAGLSKLNNTNLNMLKGRSVAAGTCDASKEQSNLLIENTSDMPSTFGMDNCLTTETTPETIGGPSNLNMPQDEWNKFQNNPFPDGFKNRTTNLGNSSVSGGGPHGCQQQNPTLSRSLSMGAGPGGYGMQSRPTTGGPSPNSRNNNAPQPPPYQQSQQRSASVPIATQSPTNINSTNPDMPLTSPQGPRPPFGTSTPPNSDIQSTSGTITNPTLSQATSSQSVMAGNTLTPPQMSSSREMDSIDNGQKLKRSSPQKFKGHGMNELPPDTSYMDLKYNNFPLNYPTCGGGGGGNVMGPMRQSMQQMPSQFCRRIDNIPLNPNCNRLSQNKPTNNFDPISSLAQMSQQLTGCGVSLSSMGSGGGGGLLDSGDLLLPGRPNDHPLDHCNSNNMSMLGMVGGGGPRSGGHFPGDMNMLCGGGDAMDHRMLNGKMCVPNMGGNFNPNSMNGMRDNSLGGCGGDMMSPNRSLGRRLPPSNFDNFNMSSSNVHIRASAPNTIQYMPARSQNMNNMRVPPNVDFFQRYSNPQMMGNMGAGHPTGLGVSPGDMTNANMMNMFTNCNQMQQVGGGMGMGGGGGGFEPNDLEIEGNLLPPNDDFMNVR